jgi:hypothetical protein
MGFSMFFPGMCFFLSFLILCDILSGFNGSRILVDRDRIIDGFGRFLEFLEFVLCDLKLDVFGDRVHGDESIEIFLGGNCDFVSICVNISEVV